MGRANEPQKRPNKPEEKTKQTKENAGEKEGSVGVIDARS